VRGERGIFKNVAKAARKPWQSSDGASAHAERIIDIGGSYKGNADESIRTVHAHFVSRQASSAPFSIHKSYTVKAVAAIANVTSVPEMKRFDITVLDLH